MSPSPPSTIGTESPSLELRVDEVCDRFEAAWKTSADGVQRPRIEDYLGAVAESEQAAFCQELIKVDMDYRRRHGEEPQPQDYSSRFPGLESAWPRSEDPGLPGYLGRYRITAKLGAGGFGVVYRGYDEELQREVAIKVAHRQRVAVTCGSPESAQRYLAEGRMLASLDHPGIVPIYDVGRADDGIHYLVSKFIAGSNLDQRMREARLSPAAAAEIVARVAEALHHAHQRGLVHRDIKSANILLDVEGHPIVVDFGLALREEAFGQGPAFVGTPFYMSPEQARGEGHRVDARTDVYSLGVVFYELLTGQRPIQGKRLSEVLELIKTWEPRPPRQLDHTVPKELDRICLKAMCKRASDRYSMALDLAEDIRHWQAGPPDSSAIADCGLRIADSKTAQSAIRNPQSAIGEVADSDQPATKVVPKGLRSFDAEDADFFLQLLPGPRDRHGLPDSIRFWKTRLEETDPDKTFRVGLIYGPSGCGKSSLVKAGLLPRLARRVVPIYLEATPEDTEVRLLRALRKRCPDLPADLHLPEALALLRRGQGLASGTKILLMLDQFEQCLHAGGEQPNSPLVQALRQCDGQRVQAVILVRDDFWMAATRFMREVEVRLLENHNSVAVDLFDLRHARKVLAEFGRAFGALPDDLSQLTREQERFLDQAVAGLAREGKVISVRLALFAEMVKTKPWTPATLKQVGGMEGIGVTFLEETFTAATAPPQHRLHQKAARAVLQVLLPQPGTDLKGHLRGRQELLEASGYTRRPREFNDLMHILDTELRLVTPADPEGVEDRGSRIEDRRSEKDPVDPRSSILDPRSSILDPRSSILDPRSSGYYQLTHDYLVPALRQWLTRKQRETHRGRTELRLAERVALWSARPETRHLPGWWEWLNFVLFTRKKDRTTTQREMMLCAASRLHLLQAGVGVILLTLAGWGVYERINYLEAVSRVQSLQSAKIDTVHRIIGDLSRYRGWADPLLRNMARGFWQGSNERLYAYLALLPVEPERLDYLYKRIPEAGLDELRVLCDALKPHQEALGPRLWAYLETETDPDRRFRVACVLSEYDVHDPRWNALSAEVTNKLIREALENPLVFDKWRSFAFGSMRVQIRPQLEAILLDPHRPEPERSMAGLLFLSVAGTAVTPKELLHLVLATEDRTYELIRRLYLAADPQEAAELLNQELAKALPANAPDEARDVLAKRQAHAAVVLLQHDQPDEIWPLPHAERIWPRLRHGPDCRLRTYLIHRFTCGGTEQASLTQQSLLRQYEEEQDVSARRALLLSLGEFQEDKLPAEKRQPLVVTLLQTYRDDPDPGIHAAVDWLLRQCWGQGAELHKIDRELSGKPAGQRQWYVNGQGQTLAVLRDPAEFLMGSPTHERDRQADESPHRKRIPRSFALATKEVTVQQFQEFLQANPGIRHDWDATRKYSKEPDAPLIAVTWFEAAQYCRWLSEREGIPEDQMCYPRQGAIKEGMQMPADYLSRTGYRLPTEAEWEYACRAGAVTSRHYGVTEDLLPKYACYAGNSRGRTQPVGRVKPNDYGLFDMYGNAWEWCQDALLPYPPSSRGQALEDREDPKAITDSVNRVLRGGSFASPAGEVRSACRFELQPKVPRNLAGLRVARTHP